MVACAHVREKTGRRAGDLAGNEVWVSSPACVQKSEYPIGTGGRRSRTALSNRAVPDIPAIVGAIFSQDHDALPPIAFLWVQLKRVEGERAFRGPKAGDPMEHNYQ